MRRETRDKLPTLHLGCGIAWSAIYLIEKWILVITPEPYAPRYDVEDIDDQQIPVRLLAIDRRADKPKRRFSRDPRARRRYRAAGGMTSPRYFNAG